MVISDFMIQLINPLLLILFVLLVFLGYRKGFLSKLLSCFSFVVIVIIGWNLAPAFSKVFHILPQSYAPYQDTPLADFFYNYANQILIFVLIVIVASLVIFLLKPIALLFKELPVISFANSLLGALFGVVEMFLLCFVLLFVLHTPIIQNGSEVIDNTFFQHIEMLQERVFTYGSEVLNDFDIMSDSLLDQVNLQELKDLLSEHGYSDEEIQDFIEKLGYSHE